VMVRAGTAYRHLFSQVKKKIICNVYYYRISDFRLVSTGNYYLVPAPIFVQKKPWSLVTRWLECNSLSY